MSEAVLTAADFDLAEEEGGEGFVSGPLSPGIDAKADSDNGGSTTSHLSEDNEAEGYASSPEEETEEFHDASEEVSPSGPGSFDCKTQDKHFFILSEAGKPIYTLHGDEEVLVSMFAVMQALVSYVADSGDTMRSIRAKNCTIVFMLRSPLILVGMSRGLLSSHQLTVQLNYLYNQVLSVLTLSQLKKVFKHRMNYDLRRMLSGSERITNHLAHQMDTDPSFFLSSVRCLCLASSIRDSIADCISRSCGKTDAVFGILIADNQLVSLVRSKEFFIHPVDLHLLFNMVSSTESFKNSESWTPICLPKFDSGGFLHAHVSYISDTSPVCLVLISVDRNAFFRLSDARRSIKEKLEKAGIMSNIQEALKSSNYTTASIEVPEMRHFLYKSRTSAQFTMPVLPPAYNIPGEKERLFSVYLSLQNRFHSSSASRSLKLCYRSTGQEVVLGWLTQVFEVYAVFSPLTNKLDVITAVNKLLRWTKREEDKLFILSAPTF